MGGSRAEAQGASIGMDGQSNSKESAARLPLHSYEISDGIHWHNGVGLATGARLGASNYASGARLGAGSICWCQTSFQR